MNTTVRNIYNYLLRHRYGDVPISQVVTYCSTGWVSGFRYTIKTYAYSEREQ